jgi:hypothetical protein
VSHLCSIEVTHAGNGIRGRGRIIIHAEGVLLLSVKTPVDIIRAEGALLDLSGFRPQERLLPLRGGTMEPAAKMLEVFLAHL